MFSNIGNRRHTLFKNAHTAIIIYFLRENGIWQFRKFSEIFFAIRALSRVTDSFFEKIGYLCAARR